MMSKKSGIQSMQGRMEGFTLVEVLIVLAIIAIVSAILFPVYFKVKENVSSANSMANMKDISDALKRFQLDHDGHSPPVLFGYAVLNFNAGTGQLTGPTTAPMSNAYATSQLVQNVSQLYFPGLFPTYISTASTFTDPDNTSVTDTETVTPNVNVLCPNVDDACNFPAVQPAGTLVAAAHTTGNGTEALPGSFYSEDAYDLSPQVTGSRAINLSTLVPRYQTSWTCEDPNSSSTMCANAYNPPTTANNDYSRQLRNPSPEGTSYVTCDTYHADKTGKVLVLFQDGTVKPVDAVEFLNLGPDVADISAPGGPAPEGSQSNVWKSTLEH